MSLARKEPDIEREKLGMICVCGDERLERARAEYKQFLEEHGLEDENFMSYAFGYLHDYHLMEAKVLVDQWFGILVTGYKSIDQHPDCSLDHDDPANDDLGCWCYELLPVRKIYVECDRLQDGFVRILNYIQKETK